MKYECALYTRRPHARIAHTLPHDFLIEPHIYFLEAHAPPQNLT